MKNKIKYFLSWVLLIIFTVVMLFGAYKIQEFKLKAIWGIENPTFFQVLDSGSGKAKSK